MPPLHIIPTSNRFGVLSKNEHRTTQPTTLSQSVSQHDTAMVTSTNVHEGNDHNSEWVKVENKLKNDLNPEYVGCILKPPEALPKGFIDGLPQRAYSHFFVISEVSGTGDLKICMITSNRKAKQKKMRIRGSEEERRESAEELVIEGTCPLQLRSWLKVEERYGISALRWANCAEDLLVAGCRLSVKSIKKVRRADIN
ncbi:hypothetical protein CSPX01_04065 [Colletotrichum filicis]|nr:hypothetical protein CSPX01_04065 [Colletotrichum filicis]